MRTYSVVIFIIRSWIESLLSYKDSEYIQPMSNRGFCTLTPGKDITLRSIISSVYATKVKKISESFA